MPLRFLQDNSFLLKAGLLLLLTSLFIIGYDRFYPDETVLQKKLLSIEETFQRHIRSYQYDFIDDITDIPTCRLDYDTTGNLINWSNNQFLPPLRNISNDITLEEKPLLQLDGRLYYQIRKKNTDGLTLILIPLHIKYEINNDLLTPYNYPGSWERLLTAQQQRLLKIRPVGPVLDSTLYAIKDVQGMPIFYVEYVSIEALRLPLRVTASILLLLALVILCIWLRRKLFASIKKITYINLIMVGVVLLIRFLIYFVGIPSQYLEIRLFAADILAFHALSPSLGELTLNIITLILVVWIIYRTSLQYLVAWYERILHNIPLSWTLSLLFVAISIFLLENYHKLVQQLVLNSTVDVEFSNIFKTSIYSYIILLDFGLLLLSFLLVIISLVQLCIMLGKKYSYSFSFWGLHLMIMAFYALIIFYQSNEFYEPYWFGMVSVAGVLLMMLAAIRIPARPITYYDPSNFLLIVGSISLIVSSNIITGVNLDRQINAESVSNKIFDKEGFQAIMDVQFSLSQLRSNEAQIEQKWESARGNTALFEKWLSDLNFTPNFKNAKVEVKVFSKEKIEEYKSYKESQISNSSPFTLKIDLESDSLLILDVRRQDKAKFFWAEFVPEKIDSTLSPRITLKIEPSQVDLTSVYPALVIEGTMYKDLQLLNSFQHALYRKGYLYTQSKEGDFPYELSSILPNHTSIENQYTRITEDYLEYVKPSDQDQLAVVRYDKQGFFEIITTLSIVFYVFTAASALLILLPIYLLQIIRGEKLIQQFSLRLQIRMVIFGVSILPLAIIVAFLSPFVERRYEEQTKSDLAQATKRVTEILNQEYQLLFEKQNKAFFPGMELFKEKFNSLVENIDYDINVYDKNGRYIASTQSPIFERGIGSNLINSVAYKALTIGGQSSLVQKEAIGKQTFFSSYRPLVGEGNSTIGFVNLPYLGKQDQLDEQILDFISYLVNIYLLLFLLFNFLGVLLSTAITQPLKLIQQRIAATQLGDGNQPIDYDRQDEIGEIVQAYNDMLIKLKDSEEQLMLSQREMAWQQMARQVAHEIRNPLTPMKLNIQHLGRAWDQRAPNFDGMFPKIMKTLLTQIDTLTRIANSFSEFAKMPEPIRTNVCINEVLADVVNLYSRAEEHIEWQVDIPSHEYWAFSDKDQLNQCFQNLVKNSIQALKERGKIEVGLKLNGNQMCQVQIHDNGSGIPEELHKRIFEPNFSTKSSGMGMGLYIVKRLVENNGGNIFFESRMNEGTTFFLEFPVISSTVGA